MARGDGYGFSLMYPFEVRATCVQGILAVTKSISGAPNIQCAIVKLPAGTSGTMSHVTSSPPGSKCI